jgi:hypothetical protein
LNTFKSSSQLPEGIIVDLTVVTYLTYLAVSIGLTAWVARTLALNGKVFLVDVFGGDERLAEAVNRLLVVGFYLVSLGFVTRELRLGEAVTSGREVVEALSGKVGTVLLVLGVMHFVNLYLFGRVRRRTHSAAASGAVAEVAVARA